MNDNIKKWIRLKAGCDYSGNIDTAISTLEKFMVISKKETDIGWETFYEDMAASNDLEKGKNAKNFTDIEKFVKDLAEIITPGILSTPPDPTNPTKAWTLAPVYKRIFNIRPNCNDFKQLDSEMATGVHDGTPKYYYFSIYLFRNGQTHDWERDMFDVDNPIKWTILSQLYLCEAYSEKISKKYDDFTLNNSRPDFDYAQKIIDEYNKATAQNIRYVDILWDIESEQGIGITISDILMASHRLVCLLGEPGCGKSTALKRINYLLADNLLNGDNKIPIYIELKKMISGVNVIQKTASEILNVDIQTIRSLIEKGDIYLLLDGYNEVLDYHVKQQIAFEIDELANLKKSNIYLSDRRLSSDTLPIMNDAVRYKFKTLSLELKKDFVDLLCDSDNQYLVYNKMDEDPHYFDVIRTPLQMLHFIDLVNTNGSIPIDFVDSYIKLLFERELAEKKDRNIKYLKDFLEALALETSESSIDHAVSEKTALKTFKKCKDIYGYENADTSDCLTLALDMHILSCEDGSSIGFICEEYEDYFSTEAILNGTEEDMNE